MKMTYEQAIKKLEEIVEKLEDGSLSIEESLELYEEGAKLSEFCHKILKEARQKLTDISEVSANENK